MKKRASTRALGSLLGAQELAINVTGVRRGRLSNAIAGTAPNGIMGISAKTGQKNTHMLT